MSYRSICSVQKKVKSESLLIVYITQPVIYYSSEQRSTIFIMMNIVLNQILFKTAYGYQFSLKLIFFQQKLSNFKNLKRKQFSTTNLK